MLFPGGRLPLRIFEQRYLEMAKGCLRDGTPFGVCLIREGARSRRAGDARGSRLPRAHHEWDMQQLGLLQLVAQGERRFRVIEKRVRADGLILAGVELLAEEADTPVAEKFGACGQLLRTHRRRARRTAVRQAVPARLERLGSRAPRGSAAAAAATQQELLELDDGPQRLEFLQRLLAENALAPRRSDQS